MTKNRIYTREFEQNDFDSFNRWYDQLEKMQEDNLIHIVLIDWPKTRSIRWIERLES